MASTDSTVTVPSDGGSDIDIVQLIACHQASVWRYLRALGSDASLADDLTQETFLEVMRKPFQHYSDQASAAYLRRVAHNLFISYRRRAGKVAVIEKVEDFERSWMRWAGFDGGNRAVEALEDCFKRLTPRAQQALKMRFGDEASRQAIAETLNISEHGAKNLMQRAKIQLRECVESKLK